MTPRNVHRPLVRPEYANLATFGGAVLVIAKKMADGQRLTKKERLLRQFVRSWLMTEKLLRHQ